MNKENINSNTELNNKIDKKDKKTEISKNTNFLSILFSFIVGLVLIGLNVIYIIKESKYYPKMLFLGCLCFYYSLAMFIAPFYDFEKECKEDKDFKPPFIQTHKFSFLILIIYLIASVVSLILIEVSDSWDLPIISLLITMFSSGVLAFVKYLLLFMCKNQQVEDVEKKFTFANPSKLMCIIAMSIGLLFAVVSGYYSYKLYLEIPKNYDVEEYYNPEYDVYIESLLDHDVSIKLMPGSNEKTISISLDYEYCREFGPLIIPMNDIIRHIVKDSNNVKELTLYKQVSEGDEVEYDLSIYTKEKLLKIPSVKKMIQENKSESCKALTFKQNKDIDFCKKMSDKNVIFSYPETSSDYIFVWDKTGFANYINNNEYITKNDDEYTAENVEMLFFNNYPMMNDVYNQSISAKEFFSLLFNETESYFGIIYNYGNEDSCYINYYDLYESYNLIK